MEEVPLIRVCQLSRPDVFRLPYFFDSLISDLESLWLCGGIHSIHFGFHRLLSRRFPFAIYYDLTEEVVRVAAILDMRRDPAWIRKELNERKGPKDVGPV